MGVHYNRKKLIRIINFLDIYQKNKESKIEIRKNLLEAGIFLYKSFELKFRQATVHGSYELALFKLVYDATNRVFN
jgi:hypothetical protein